MAGIGNNLYPPIFKKAYLPAFTLQSGECRIYFSLSNYNSLKSMNLNLVQISVQNQNTNYSALRVQEENDDSTKPVYPAGIKMAKLEIDNNRNSDDKYFVVIKSEDLQSGFEVGQYYKVQIRFTDTDENIPAFENTDEWFTANLSHFSEWSQVVLIKCISAPSVQLRNFSSIDEGEGKTFTLKDIDLTGRVTFEGDQSQYLRKYRVYLYDSNKKLIEDSKDIFLNIYTNLNEIKYKIKTILKDGESYKIVIRFQTNNLYEWKQQYDFTLNLIQYTTLDSNNIFIKAEADKNAGWIQVHVYSLQNIQNFGMNLVIKRSSSKDGFNTQEDMFIFYAAQGKKIDFIWKDKIIESGVWYKYSVQQINEEGFRSNTIKDIHSVMCEFQDIFLLNQHKQLKVRFNPQINNYSHVVAESLTQTIGSQYPFIRRNGNTNYRSFTLSGTITHFMDERQNGMKASEENLYDKTILEDYEDYKKDNGITLYNNFLYEKDFRQQVISFLYENNVKLYKSTTEGNILVKLMNISFTPNNTLGRQIYDFSCTVQQVVEFNIENCELYNIQERGKYQYINEIILTKYGQVTVPSYGLYYKNDSSIESQAYNNRNVQENYFKGSQDIIKEYILPKYNYLKTDLIDIRIEYLTSLKIEFTSPPYLISIKEGKYTKYSVGDTEKPILTGHVVYINGEPIIVGPEGILELSDPETKITALSFLSEKEKGIISYEANITKFEKSNVHPRSYENIKRIGQLFGHFNVADSIFGKIYRRYYFNSTQMTKRLQKIKGLRIYAEPNTLLLVKEQQDNESYNPVLIGETGLLEFYETDIGGIQGNDTNITGIYPLGPKLKRVSDSYTGELKDNQYVYDSHSYGGIQEISNPQKNHVYSILEEGTTRDSIAALKSKIFPSNEENRIGLQLTEGADMLYVDYQTILLILHDRTLDVIYYQGGWALFSKEDETVLVPMPMIIDYYCEILKKEYDINESSI